MLCYGAVVECRALLAKSADFVDFKDGLLSNKTCVLRNPVLEPSFPCIHITHGIELYCTFGQEDTDVSSQYIAHLL